MSDDLVEKVMSGLTVKFLAYITKNTLEGIKGLFSGDQRAIVLDSAFEEFRNNCGSDENKNDEILVEAFREFFNEGRVKTEFQQVFTGQGEKVDFSLLEEVFVEICDKNRIKTNTFNFYQALTGVIREIETLAQENESFGAIFNTANLDRIRVALEKPGLVRNHSIARQKYLSLLSNYNKRLQFTGIPDLQEKKDITLPSVFVMQRVVESVAEEEYRRLMREASRDKDFNGEELRLQRMIPDFSSRKKAPVKFNKVLNKSKKRRFVVLGKPGSGKSSLLKYLMLEAADKQLKSHRDSGGIYFQYWWRFEN
ncbi:MAG: hypothetical protein GY757_61555 [bacterium]|nr:hypothetical protein [bacterium]